MKGRFISDTGVLRALKKYYPLPHTSENWLGCTKMHFLIWINYDTDMNFYSMLLHTKIKTSHERPCTCAAKDITNRTLWLRLATWDRILPFYYRYGVLLISLLLGIQRKSTLCHAASRTIIFDFFANKRQLNICCASSQDDDHVEIWISSVT